MPTGPQGQCRPAEPVVRAVRVGGSTTGEIQEHHGAPECGREPYRSPLRQIGHGL